MSRATLARDPPCAALNSQCGQMLVMQDLDSIAVNSLKKNVRYIEHVMLPRPSMTTVHLVY